jgi:transcription initiation factor TFIID subunit 6
LDDIIAANNQTIKLPNDISLKAHWLAIEGIQPSVPENPETLSKEFQKKDLLEGV